MKNDPRNWPKLSETLTGPRGPGRCQDCGGSADDIVAWIECDERDQPTRVVVLLCKECGERIVGPHPRLYHALPENKPVPGAMPHLCLDCEFRKGLTCTHPDLKANGGPGLNLAVVQPLRGFVDGHKYRGPFENWPRRAEACQGRKVVGQ